RAPPALRAPPPLSSGGGASTVTGRLHSQYSIPTAAIRPAPTPSETYDSVWSRWPMVSYAWRDGAKRWLGAPLAVERIAWLSYCDASEAASRLNTSAADSP